MVAIPDYATLMLPLLKIAGDGQEHRVGDVIGQLVNTFSLTEPNGASYYPAGRKRRSRIEFIGREVI